MWRGCDALQKGFFARRGQPRAATRPVRYLDRMFFRNVVDLARKLEDFRIYYNAHRVHRSLEGTTVLRKN